MSFFLFVCPTAGDLNVRCCLASFPRLLFDVISHLVAEAVAGVPTLLRAKCGRLFYPSVRGACDAPPLPPSVVSCRLPSPCIVYLFFTFSFFSVPGVLCEWLGMFALGLRLILSVSGPRMGEGVVGDAGAYTVNFLWAVQRKFHR